MALGSSIETTLAAIGGGMTPIPGGSLAGGALGGYLGGLFDPSNPTQARGQQQQAGGLNLPTQQIPTVSQNQLQALMSLLQTGMAGAGQGLDFGPIREQAMSQFQEQTVPSLAERFTRLGSRGSSAFTQQLGQAGAGLKRDLAAQEAQFGLQKHGALANLLKMGLAPQFGTVAERQGPGVGESLAGNLGPAIEALIKILPLLMKGRGGQPPEIGEQAPLPTSTSGAPVSMTGGLGQAGLRFT